MLHYRQLYDQVEKCRPFVTKDFEFARYVEIHKNQVCSTETERVHRIKDQFYLAHKTVEQDKLERIWAFIGSKIEKNAGLAEFILDYDGAKSKFFFPWLINVFQSPATALEISYGSGPDINGKWIKDILQSNPKDPFIPFILDDPAFVYNRERQFVVANLATFVQNEARRNKSKAKIVDFGAGRLAWVRRHGFEIGTGSEVIYAFDSDSSIQPSLLFDKDLKELGIKYKHGDLTDQFANPDCKDTDLIILGGVASYISPEVFTNKMIVAIHNLLKPGGVFFFDLQTDCPCYRHSIDILDWPDFHLPDSPEKVMCSVEKMRKDLWTKGLRFSAEYSVDTYNKIPSAVMITMQKI